MDGAPYFQNDIESVHTDQQLAQAPCMGKGKKTRKFAEVKRLLKPSVVQGCASELQTCIWHFMYSSRDLSCLSLLQ